MKRIRSDLVIIQRTIRRISGVIPFTGVLFLFSCEDVMDVSFSGNSEKSLVVEGVITTDTMSHMVALSLTGDFFNKPEKEMVSGAEVTISDGDTTFLLHEVSTGEYFTDSTVHGEVGKTYTLDIRLSDSRQYTASDELRRCADIDSIGQSGNYNSYLDGYGYYVLFYAKEPQPLGDNYMYLVYIDNVLYSDTLSEIAFASDEFVNGKDVRDFQVYRIREADIPDTGATVTLEMYSVTRNYYDFMSAMMLETVWKGSPWDGPPSNVNGNVSNGARGYFRASAVKRRSRHFKALPRGN
jgi:hypothetical protein